MKYYNLTGNEQYDELGYGYARAPAGLDFDALNRGQKIERWSTPVFQLIDGKLADDLANDNGWHLYSSKARAVLNESGSLTNYQWLPAIVKDSNGENYEYSILHCIKMLECIDNGASTYVAGQLVKPVFSKKCIGDLRVFSYPESESSLIIDELLVKAIQRANLTGFGFTPVKTI